MSCGKYGPVGKRKRKFPDETVPTANNLQFGEDSYLTVCEVVTK
jgi:hypothetical protein